MPKKQGSTSFGKVERSKRLQDVIDLGNRIVKELELQEGVDTLAKWMAHYLAELISQASEQRNATKRKKLQASCCEIIERLWKNRSNLPGGAKPLGRIESQLVAIEAMVNDLVTTPRAYRHAIKDTTNPWLVFAVASHAIDRRMAAIALLSSFLETDFDREKQWLVEHPQQLSKQEREAINSLDGWLESKNSLLTRSKQKPISDLITTERRNKILDELENALAAQQGAYTDLKNSLQSP